MSSFEAIERLCLFIACEWGPKKNNTRDKHVCVLKHKKGHVLYVNGHESGNVFDAFNTSEIKQISGSHYFTHHFLLLRIVI